MEFSAYTPWLFIALVFVFVVCWGLFGADLKPHRDRENSGTHWGA